MNQKEKHELLKGAIFQMYSKEGRSRVYISKLLGLNRKILGEKIREWDFPAPAPQRHLTASRQKFLNKHKQLIKARLDADVSINDICEEIGCTRSLMRTLFEVDSVLRKATQDKNNRMHMKSKEYKQSLMDKSARNYITSLDGEEWRPILGYENYEVSSLGRVRNLAKRYGTYYEIRPCFNSHVNRVYVSLSGKKRKSFSLARLVAHAFCEGYSEKRCTVNHKDGDTKNNMASNLEWVSQAENNLHAFRVLHRKPAITKKTWHEIHYGKYVFKTVRAFAKFINLSETQTHRWIQEPEKHGIKLK